VDNQFHPMTELFLQLGLPSGSDEIESFFKQHKLDSGVPLIDASFFTYGQKQFLKEALAADSDWAEIVDQMDARLHN